MPDFRFLFAGLLIVFQIGVFQTAAASEVPSNAAGWGEWDQARSLYDAGKYDEALVSLMSKPPHEGAQDFRYFFNVGTVFYRLGRFGHALAFLEKANRIQSHEPNVQHNLNIARNALAMRLGAAQIDPSSTFLEGLADRVSLDQVRATLGLLALALGLILTKNYLKMRSLSRTMLHPASFLLIVAVAITGSLYLAQRYSDAHPPVFCVQSETIRSGPGERYSELYKVEPGVKLRLTGVSSSPSQAGDETTWQQVRYSPDAVGWIKASSLLLL